MRKTSRPNTALPLIVAAAFFFVFTGMDTKPTEENFKKPNVAMNYVEVAHYWGWWYFKKDVPPTAGDPGYYGAPLDLVFSFDIENPNSFPIHMESLKFTIAFEEFDLNTVQTIATQWIPPGKTNQIRVHAMFDGRQALLRLLVDGGNELKEKGMGQGAGAALKQLEKWWLSIPEFGFPIHVKEGSAVFTADSVTRVVPFSAKYPSD